MLKKDFYQILDQYAEVWYIDSGPKLLELSSTKFRRCKSGRDHIPADEIYHAIAQTTSNYTGYPIIERWKRPKEVEIINLRKYNNK